MHRTPKVPNTRNGIANSLHESIATADLPTNENELTAPKPVSLVDIPPQADPRELLFQKLQKFEQDIARAQTVGEADKTGKKWIEADTDVIEYFFPQGLGGAKYAIYKGVFVTPTGDKTKTVTEMEKNSERAQFNDPRIRIVGSV